MIIGVPREVKNNENRVAMTPASVSTLIQLGHRVLVEQGAGEGSGFFDQYYEDVGAELMNEAETVWRRAEMIVKVKEPLPSEYQYFRQGLILFTYLHLAAVRELAEALMKSGVIAIAYETVQIGNTLPLLTPMSEVAGRMATQVGAQFLEKPKGGTGILLSGVPGVSRGTVTIIGGGIVGTNAAKIAIGLGANVTIIDLNPNRLRELDDLFGYKVQTMMSNPLNIAEYVAKSDLVIGAVLIPGAKAPKLVSEEMIKAMRDGSVIVDVAIDQGGIFETIDKVTTHDQPTYTKHGVVHYAVANMPGAVPRTSTIALTNVTLPYILQIAKLGIRDAVLRNGALLLGLNVAGGSITYKAVADDLQLAYKAAEETLDSLS
ncbi:alanine dehydrogenase [Halalkalibacter sp. APA_J-10(15)]|uniref:alanine dehydrogenase n=1 Tax=Halalkalibacter sp. APA_J-10(15) TaxID=2933805 RepID=UPI001FF6393E|nr:alanine dehydrogenase [Halalkalibacter sp. APA_J-10(15)]MCK0471854.1 alanine dehydrogenase [Halalkalibacter sp. APA_J-10(15)]